MEWIWIGYLGGLLSMILGGFLPAFNTSELGALQQITKGVGSMNPGPGSKGKQHMPLLSFPSTIINHHYTLHTQKIDR
jgi:hypothetical protein